MTETNARVAFRQCFIEAVRRDTRVIGLLQGGSGSEGRADQWSDLDVFLFVRDEDIESFKSDWSQWVAQCGQLLLAYHPDGQSSIAWTVFHADPFPLRVDFRIFPESQIESILSWPTSPLSTKDIVLVDKTDGHLSEIARQLVGRSQRLPDSQEPAMFEQQCNSMWYFLHSAYCKLERGQEWYARISFHMAVLDSLIALLKLESGSVERWLASFPTWHLEQLVSSTRLRQLNECIPLPGAENLKLAMIRTAQLGTDVCETLAMRYHCAWPKQAAEEIIKVLTIG